MDVYLAASEDATSHSRMEHHMATTVICVALISTILGAASAQAAAAQTEASLVTETRFLAVDGGRNGPLILAIPGMGDLRSEYRRLRPALQHAGYRLVCTLAPAKRIGHFNKTP